MTTMNQMLSPKNNIGATVISVGVHAVAVLAVVVSMNMGSNAKPEEMTYIDLGYEVLDAPPVQTEEVQKLKRSPTPTQPVQEKAVTDNQPREMQDQNSDIAGTDKEKKSSDLGSDSNGSATATPFYKIKPKYPRAALASGIEGWVLMKIDITEGGEVENVRVVDGEQQELFQNEARRAVALWKYRPFLNGEGSPIRKPNFQVMVSFKLEEQ